MESNSIRNSFSSLCTHPLFSTVITLHTLILLYAPSLFIAIAFSPVLNSIGILLLSLLRLGANERSEKESNSPESRILDSDTNCRSRKESDSRESDHNHTKWLLVEEGSLSSYLGVGFESDSLESRFLYSADQNQTHVESESKSDLGSEFNQIHVESDPKAGLSMEFNQVYVEGELKTGLTMESNETQMEFDCHKWEFNQTHVESEAKTGLGSESNSQDDYHKWESLETTSMETAHVIGEEDPRRETHAEQVDTTTTFLEWNMKAPLEVIYEAYEGEEEEEEEEEEEGEDEESNGNNDVAGEKRLERYPSLSMYYPESDADSSSDGEFPVIGNWETQESVFYKWEEEEREELIEISLDHYGKRRIEFCHVEEDNLIEIDIFRREIEHSGEKIFRRG